jgi:hypothetical protein
LAISCHPDALPGTIPEVPQPAAPTSAAVTMTADRQVRKQTHPARISSPFRKQRRYRWSRRTEDSDE